MTVWKRFLCCTLAVLFIESSEACTGIIQKAQSGDWVYARTMEFGEDFVSFDLLFVPRNIDHEGLSNDAQPGAKWKNKYAHVGFNPFGMPLVADGLNEKGLACGAFYFPGWAEYEQVGKEKHTLSISNLDFVSWVLGNFATVDELLEALKITKVTGLLYKPWGIVPPLHYLVVDQKGNKVVIEYVKGKLNVYEATLGTITNSPSYDWHEINARNYIGLQALNRPSLQISGQELASFGQGSGAIGLPGDFTPPSRFIRATFLNQVTLPAQDALSAVKRAFKILNQFDIPKGAVKEVKDGKPAYEETQWTSAADLTHARYFYHTFRSRVIRVVNLKNLDLNAKEVRSFSIDNDETFIDVSSNFKESKA